MTKGVHMTEKEIQRAEVLSKIAQKKLSQIQAADELGLSVRQVQRLYTRYIEEGLTSLVSKKRGKPGNRQLKKLVRARVSEIVTCKIYAGFRPTLMSEKLEELHNIKISRETTRKIMIQQGVWTAKKEKRPVVHQQRPRRARCGELLQIDGSPHAWFEDRGEPCDLLVFIDDATGRTYGKFFESETTEAYMITMQEYIKKYGKPLAVYSDKHSIFRINKPGCVRKDNLTQFARALRELEVDIIYANSPQAKGRVERSNQTLQDRLIKEMRLARINTLEQGNKFLEKFWDKHNKKFAVVPACPEDAHRRANSEVNLDRVLCKKYERKITKNFEFQFENTIYQVKEEKPSHGLKGARVTILKHLNGVLQFECKGKDLRVQKYEQVAGGTELSAKELDSYFARRGLRGHKVPKNHPWLQEGRVEALRRAQEV